MSPPLLWDDGTDPTSIALLPVHSDANSRMHSLHPSYADCGDDSTADWRIGEGPAGRGLGSWLEGGKLGWWLWNTQRGWLAYVILLIVLHGAASLSLLVMNRFILWSR